MTKQLLIGLAIGAACTGLGFMLFSGSLPEPVASSDGNFKLLAQVIPNEGESPSDAADAENGETSPSDIIEVRSAPKAVKAAPKTTAKASTSPAIKKETADDDKVVAKEVAPVVVKCAYDTSAKPKLLGIMSEVAWMGSGDDSNAEWVEMQNHTTGELSVAGWQLVDKAQQLRAIIPNDVILPKGGFLVFERGTHRLPGTTVGYTGVLSNTDEGLRLFNKSCELQDEVVAQSAWPAGTNTPKHTAERRSDLSWHTYYGPGEAGIFGTPGMKNSAGAPTPPVVAVVVAPACADKLDNDHDGLIDLRDPGCLSSADADEYNASPPVALCADGLDNDGDNLIDLADLGCSGASDNDETNVAAPVVAVAACADSLDNDKDGLVDLADPGCNGSSDDDEVNVLVVAPACADTVDNDADGLVDMNDSGCASGEDADEFNEAVAAVQVALCSDGADNDSDGLTDMNDPGCADANDNDEANAVVVAPPGGLDHIVISEIQTTGGAGHTAEDYIEIYNPLSQPFNLNGYRLVKRAKTGTTDTSLKSWTSDTFIPAGGYYIWSNSTFTAISKTPNITTTGTIADDNGAAIRQGAENTGTIIDAVGWGAAANTFVEGSVFSTNPGASVKLKRKQWQDTNNNSADFELGS